MSKNIIEILSENVIIKRYRLIILALIAGFCGSIIMYFFVLFGLL
jgi:hypothetical protein